MAKKKIVTVIKKVKKKTPSWKQTKKLKTIKKKSKPSMEYSTTTATAPEPSVYPEQPYQPVGDPLLEWEKQYQFREWVSQNKRTINGLFKRWANKELTDEELSWMAQGGPQAETYYNDYEIFRKFESYRPFFWQYYGMEPSRKQIEQAEKIWGEPERMQDGIELHRKAQSVWMKYYGRKITTSELNQIREGKTPTLPKLNLGSS